MRFNVPMGRLLAVLFAAVLFIGCSDSNNPGDTQIRLVNNTGATILFVYYSDCNDNSWGSDRLDDNETIANGAERRFGVNAGCYDLRADVANNGSITLFDVLIDDNEVFTWNVIN